MTVPTIVHFIETDIAGGAESLLINICRYQKQAGLNPVIAHFNHPYFVERCAAEGIASFDLPPRHLFKSMRTLSIFCWRFAKLLRQANASLLHSHLFGPIVGGALAAKFAGIPHVGTLHDIYMIQESPARARQLQVALFLGSRLVAVSQQMKSFYERRLRFRPQQLSCIHNGVELQDSGHVTRAEFGLTDSDFVVIVVGRLIPLKRVQDAIEALGLIEKKINIKLLIVGEGPEQTMLQENLQRHHLENCVQLLGARADVASLLKISNCFVQCSESEGLSMSILEALHSGLPCIVSDVGGNKELVIPEVNGWLYDVGDQAALSQKLLVLCREPEVAKRFSAESKRFAQTEFSLNACVRNYTKLYRDLCDLDDAS